MPEKSRKLEWVCKPERHKRWVAILSLIVFFSHFSGASAQIGDFVDAEPLFNSPAGVGVLRGPANHATLGQIGANQIGVDRSGDGLLDDIYNIPAEILTNSAGNTLEFRLSPTQDALYTRRFNINGAPVCGGRFNSNLVYFHRLETAPASTGLASAICLDGPISIQPRFFDDPAAARRTAVMAAAPNAASGRQSVAWVDLADGGYNVDGFSYQPDVQNSANGIQFAPDGRSAFIDHGAGTAFRRFAMVDLCSSPVAGASAVSVGSLNNGIARAQVIAGSGGELLAELRLNGTVQAATRITLGDCSSVLPPNEFNLIVEKSGNGMGSISSQPGSINCGAACQQIFTANTVVTLNAQADFGSTFDGWSGDCSGSATSIQVMMDTSRNCVASFSRPEANIRTLVNANPTPAIAGLSVTLDISVINDGPDTASTSLDFPSVAGLTLQSVDLAECNLNQFQNRINCNFNNLPGGQARDVTVQATVDPAARGSMEVVANASSFVFDPDTSDNNKTLVLPLMARADIEVSINGLPDPVPAGELLAYRVEVINHGPSAATQIELAHTLPPGTSLVDSAPAGCVSADVAPAAVTTFTLLAAVDAALTPGTILNTTVSGSSAEPDPVGSNNAATVSVNVGASNPPPVMTGFNLVVGFDEPDPSGTTNLRQFFNASWRGDHIAFHATNQVPLPADYFQGIYRVRNGRLLTIADTNTQVPGSTEAFQSFSVNEARISSSGHAAFDRFEDRGCALAPILSPVAHGIFDYQVVAMHGNQIALQSANGFMGDALQVWDGSQLVQMVNQATLLPGQTEASVGFGNSVAMHNGDLAFFAVVGTGNSGIFIADAVGGFELIADENTALPGGTGTFAGFDQNADVIGMDAHGVVFRGYNSQGVAGNTGNRGIYYYDRLTKQLERVADGNTPIPGGTGTFSYFGEAFPSTSTFNNPATENGSVVFFGSDDSSTTAGGGLYRWKAGVITTLVEQGDLIDGLPAQHFSTTSRSLGNGGVVFVVARGTSPGTANTTDVYTLGIDTGLLFKDGFEGF